MGFNRECRFGLPWLYCDVKFGDSILLTIFGIENSKACFSCLLGPSYGSDLNIDVGVELSTPFLL